MDEDYFMFMECDVKDENGKLQTIEVVPGGSDIPILDDNKHEYIK